MNPDPIVRDAEPQAGKAPTFPGYWPQPDSEEETRQRCEFLTMIADGSKLEMNNIPWREAYIRMRAIIDQRPEDELRDVFKDFLNGD